MSRNDHQPRAGSPELQSELLSKAQSDFQPDVGHVTYALSPSPDLQASLELSADFVTEQPPPGDVDAWVHHARRGKRVLRIVRSALPDAHVRAELAQLADGLTSLRLLPSPATATLPLFGRRVLVTRATHQAGTTSALLRSLAAQPVEIPAIVIEPPDDPSDLREAVRHLGRYAWLAMTSSNAVEALFGELAAAALDSRALGHLRIAAIGPATETALRRHGVCADVVATEHRGEGLASSIVDDLRARGAPLASRVLWPRAAQAREVLPTQLRAAGLEVDAVEAYRTTSPTADSRARLVTALDQGIDAVLFTSSSTVEQVMAAVPDARTKLANVTVASIGPITSDTCRKHGLDVHVEADPFTVPALVSALARHFHGTGSPSAARP